MAVRFKFRSSVDFDSIDIGVHPSISVRDLRARIADRKKLQICADFDLVLSDANTGQAFENEDFQIPAGASVVIKRVPTGREVANDRAVIVDAEGKSEGYVGPFPFSSSENVGIDSFDDFGVDLYPNLEAQTHAYADIMDHFNSTVNRKEDVVIRFSNVPNLRGQKNEGINLSEALSKEVAGKKFTGESDKGEEQEEMNSKYNVAGKIFRRKSDNGENHEEINSKYNVDLKKKLSEDMPFQLMLNAELPAELRCSLCNTIFEEAVMIPCCQHSFCNRCIAFALVKQSSCPKCSSTKCTVKDLLPNLSLRQAIEHFLEAQNPINTPYNNLPRYAPDGESGIQTKEVSYAVSIQQQETACPPSPSTTGMGSNHVISEPAYEISKESAEFDGSHSSKRLRNALQKEEGNFPFPRKDEQNIQGGRCVILPSKHRKHERNCYMCGSPDHLIRECPHGKTGNAVFSGGIPQYREGYWHGAPFSNVRPYANMYGAPAVMPFDPMVFPVAGFGISSCVPPMYGGLPTPYGFMRTGAVPPLMMSAAEAGTRAETMNNQARERKRKNELQKRYHDSDLSEDYYSGGRGRSNEQRIQPDKGTSSDIEEQRARKKHSYHKHTSPHQRPSYQLDKFHLVDEKHKESRILACGRDRITHYSEKIKSDLQDVSDGSRRHSGERKKHQYKSSKHSDSDCSWKSHHRSWISEDDEFVTHPKRHRYKHYNQSESGLEPVSSTEPRKFNRERESSHSSRHAIKIVRSRDDRLGNDTWEMDKGLEEREREDHRYHKCRRIR